MHLTPRLPRTLLALLLLGFLVGQFAQAARACTLTVPAQAWAASAAAQADPIAGCNPESSQTSGPCLASLTAAAAEPIPAPTLPTTDRASPVVPYSRSPFALPTIATIAPPDEPVGGPSRSILFCRLLI